MKKRRFSKSVEKTDTLFEGYYKNHYFNIQKEDEPNKWYIIVTDPSGEYCYDGYWETLEESTIDDAIEQAIKGSCIK